MKPLSLLHNARRQAVRVAALALGAASLSACAYGYGDYGGYGGYGGVSVGVGSGGYAGGFDPYCDGFSAWDSWYGCDAGYGFGQIGYGGGYWNNFYYPGYGLWLYDRPGGRRFAMDDRQRRYWGQRRWEYQQQRRADRRDLHDDRRDYRDDRRDWRRDRRETLDDRRDWRREREANGQEFPRTRRGERERMGGLTPEDRQRRMERWQQSQQDQIGQPQDGRSGWQGRGEGRGRGDGQFRGDGQVRGDGQGRGAWQGRGEGRARPEMQQPQPGAQPGFTPPPRAERPPRMERPPRAERPPQMIDRPTPRGPASVPDRDGVRQQDVRED
ncbi:hypothetical protein [Blastomonas sp. SL216]|uniref:hypothetical protein n=1 Tax=Blastomonas sp. SL216 TaxID=2995169 RepID=UPI002377BDB2|nr:hypothetical protein OU999_03025 [Blastomonas sp. SL216]